MIRGENVFVIRKEEVGKDAFGEPIVQELPVEQVYVVIDPSPNKYTGSGAEVNSDARDQSADITFVCHFPKTYTERLYGADIIVRGHRCRVIGDPESYTVQRASMKYNRPVEVRVIDG